MSNCALQVLIFLDLFQWCSIAKRRMWSPIIVIVSEELNDLVGIFNRVELIHVQALVSKPSVETFYVRVFNWLSWPDELQFYIVLVNFN